MDSLLWLPSLLWNLFRGVYVLVTQVSTPTIHAMLFTMLGTLGFVLMTCRTKRHAFKRELEKTIQERNFLCKRTKELMKQLHKNLDGTKPMCLSQLTSELPIRETVDVDSLSPGIRSSKFFVQPHEVHVLNVIGRGGFGTVYRGTFRGTPVAVKLLFVEDVSDVVLQRMLREADIMATLRHPNIVLYLGYSILENKTVAFMTELMTRGSLFSILHTRIDDGNGKEVFRHALTMEQRFKMFMHVTRGLAYLHACEPCVVHRDMKSLNVLVSEDLTAKVADFGLSAFRMDTMLQSGHSFGTPEWSAPELLRNERHGTPADIYALGVVLWELITRKIPFAGRSGIQVISYVGLQGGRLPEAEPSEDVVLDAVWGRINEQLNELVQACTHPNPALRPTASEVLDRLQQIRSKGSVLRSEELEDNDLTGRRDADYNKRLPELEYVSRVTEEEKGTSRPGSVEDFGEMPADTERFTPQGGSSSENGPTAKNGGSRTSPSQEQRRPPAVQNEMHRGRQRLGLNPLRLNLGEAAI